MLSHGINESEIKQIEEGGLRAWASLDKKKKNSPHHDEKTWLLPNCSRTEAEQYLHGLPTGTFLIRARDAGHYALTITCKGSINHIIIFETNRGYGFAEPYNIYGSIKSLVLHYAQNSLEEHNDALQTTLKYPVFCPYIKQLQSQNSEPTSQ